MEARYDPDVPEKLACDASSYGLEAVFSHVYENGNGKPIGYASSTMSKAETNYAQIER